MSRTIALLLALAIHARAQAQCPIADGANPSIGVLSKWTGHIGRHRAKCVICSSVLILDQPAAWLLGTCRIRHFQHRDLFTLATGGDGPTGFLCKPSTSVTDPMSGGCCTVTAEPLSFDTTHSASSVRGRITCDGKQFRFYMARRHRLGVGGVRGLSGRATHPMA